MVLVGATVAVLNRKGGVGKTTTAVGIAGALAEHRRVRLVDADPQGSATRWLSGWGGCEVVHAPTAEAVVRALDHQVDAATTTVVDGPPFDAARIGAVLARADLVVVPVLASILDLEAALPLLEAARGRVVVVLNMVDRRALVTADMRAVAARHARVAGAELVRRVAHVEAAVARLPVTVYAPGSPAATEVRALAAEVVGLLEA